MSKLKIQKRKARSIAKAARFVADMSPEWLHNLNEATKGMTPREVAKWMLRVTLAHEVCEYTKANLPNVPQRQVSEEELAEMAEHIKETDGSVDIDELRENNRAAAKMTTHQMADTIDADSVVEMLEHIVHGSAIIDDGRVHAWHKKKLGEYVDACIAIDGPEGEEIERFASAVNLCTAFRTYDLLLELANEKTSAGLYANSKARALLPELQGPHNWEDLPGDNDLTQGFKVARITREDGKTISPSDVRNLASELAKASGLRTGILGSLGNVEPVSP